jgi:hypothetical protein
MSVVVVGPPKIGRKMPTATLSALRCCTTHASSGMVSVCPSPLSLRLCLHSSFLCVKHHPYIQSLLRRHLAPTWTFGILPLMPLVARGLLLSTADAFALLYRARGTP